MIMLDQAVYVYSMLAGLLIIVLLAVSSLFELKGIVKIFFTASSIALIVLHYTALYMMARYERIAVYPFTILEEAAAGGSISPDVGQITILVLLFTWRREAANTLRRLLRFENNHEAQPR
ncbi:hypothetical protein [Desulfurococcus mucosus]|uniref:Uncharacterized protein n=1 Tax=Desulfurococcus mucosus (strain ATCC 35584 / DSM 2162 / JCM 9187 / O7/1) TaxID=765177 RepID=E8RAC6_DESM0|nr:hypothetical protein [Desulfurococcus mucosus]ADV65432.1 hypothetical protein Desmu_1130 [Desulfurococcus mucosus DSM 2162]